MRKAGLASLIVLCFAGGLAGCTSEATSPSTVGADDEARVGALIDRFFGLAEKQDWDSVGELLSEDFEIYFDEASAFSKTAYLDLLKGEIWRSCPGGSRVLRSGWRRAAGWPGPSTVVSLTMARVIAWRRSKRWFSGTAARAGRSPTPMPPSRASTPPPRLLDPDSSPRSGPAHTPAPGSHLLATSSPFL